MLTSIRFVKAASARHQAGYRIHNQQILHVAYAWGAPSRPFSFFALDPGRDSSFQDYATAQHIHANIVGIQLRVTQQRGLDLGLHSDAVGAWLHYNVAIDVLRPLNSGRSDRRISAGIASLRCLPA